MLASGLDTRAYRLAWTPGTTVFDLDQESVTTFKSNALAEFSPTSDHRPVGADLRYDWPTRLLDAGFDSGKPAVWLVEGLLPYLPPDAQDALLDNITGLSAPGSALIIESVTDTRAPEHDEFQAELDQVSERQRQQGHDLDIGTLMYDGDRHETASYLDTAGWNTTLVSATELFAACGRPLTNGERPFPDGRTVLATKS
jgi:methyltransferase (TIGR00027 family)